MSKDLFYQMRCQEVAHLLTELEDGNVSALQVYANFKRTKDLIDEAIKQIEPIVLNEANLYAEKTFKQDGFTFEKRNGSTRFSYTHIPEVQNLKQQLTEIAAKSKHAYICEQKGILVADENGEEIILPKVSYTKDVLILKK